MERLPDQAEEFIGGFVSTSEEHTSAAKFNKEKENGNMANIIEESKVGPPLDEDEEEEQTELSLAQQHGLLRRELKVQVRVFHSIYSAIHFDLLATLM
jgi:hypothetical protein